MKKLIVLLALTFALVLTASPFIAIPARAGSAPVDSGNTILERCQGYDNNWNTYDGGFCMGFLFGTVNQAVNRNNPAAGRKMGPPLICLPDGVTFEQMRKIVVRWLNNHRESLNKAGTYLVIQALQETYPCATQ